MKYIALSALAFAIGMASVPANAAAFVEGQDYKVLSNPETIAGDAIVVREFFWYGCPHCYRLNPFIEKWAKTRAKDVAFFRTPAAMNPVWEVGARGFYTAQIMGAEEKTHEAMFDAIQKENKRLFDQNSVTDWYASQGLDRQKFTNLYNSFAVSTKIARSQAGAKRYQLTGTPAVVIQGKYVVLGEDAKVIQVMDFLIDKVRSEKKK